MVGEKLMFLLCQGVLQTGKVQHSNNAFRESWLVHWTISTQDLGVITEEQLKLVTSTAVLLQLPQGEQK